jgi:hypothetical protein
MTSSDSILKMKEEVQAREGNPIAEQRLFSGGMPLNDDLRTLGECKIGNGSTVRLKGKGGLLGGMLHETSGRADYEALPEMSTCLKVFAHDSDAGSEPLLTMQIPGATTGRDVLEALAMGHAATGVCVTSEPNQNPKNRECFYLQFSSNPVQKGMRGGHVRRAR